MGAVGACDALATRGRGGWGRPASGRPTGKGLELEARDFKLWGEVRAGESSERFDMK